LAVLGAVLAIAGIVGAWVLYGARKEFVSEPLMRLGGVYTVLYRRYYVDEFYMWLIDKLSIAPAFAISAFDRQWLDGLINSFASGFGTIARGLRLVQTGRVQNYGLVLFAGLGVIALVLILVPLARS
jgi:NADH-quinone oxidoreductase subunit L